MTADIGFQVFDTAIGDIAIAWGAGGILRVHLPAEEPGAVAASLLRRLPGAKEQAPPADVARVIACVRSLLSGERSDLSMARLDMSGIGDLNRKIYEVTRRIAPGSTRSYGEIAKEVGDAALAQAVGQAMARNPFPILVPCHRVVAAGGKSGGFSAPGGIKTKVRILEIEGFNLSRQIALF